MNDDWRRIEEELISFFETQGFFVASQGDKFLCSEDFGEDDDFNVTELAKRLADMLAKT